MSDNNNNELDQYGVWVKNPPHTQDDSLPDFSFLDTPSEQPDTFNETDTALTADELSNVTADITSPESTAESEIDLSDIPDLGDIPDAGSVDDMFKTDDTGTDQEIDLDSFMDEGFTKNPDAPEPVKEAAKPAEAKSDFDPSAMADGEISLDDFFDAPSGGSSGDGEISLDDFMDTSSFNEEPKAEEIVDEAPMDIDLEFDNSMENLGVQEDEEPEQETVKESAPVEEEIEEEEEDEKPRHKEPELNDGEEFVDLSDFGIDDNDLNPTLPGGEEKKEQKQTVDYNMTVETDDDDSESSSENDSRISSENDQNIDLSSDTKDHTPGENSNTSNPTNFSAPDDDFDVDALMNSVVDEKGETTTIGDKPAMPVQEEISASLTDEPEVPPAEEKVSLSDSIEDVPEMTLEEPKVEDLDDFNTDNIFEEPVTDADISDTIPDSFDEETASLGLNDLPDPTVDSETAPAVENNVIEEPVLDEPVLDEPVFEEPVFDEPAPEQPVADEKAEEPLQEPSVTDMNFNEPAVEDAFAAPVDEPLFEELNINEETAIPSVDEKENENADETITEPVFNEPSAEIENNAFEESAFNTELEEENDNADIPETLDLPEFSDEGKDLDNAEPDMPVFEEEKETIDFTEDAPEAELPYEEPAVSVTAPAENKTSDDNMTADVLKQIVGELNSLKSEISGLKNDLANIKNTRASDEVESNKEENGFFSGLDEDDTIALSGDELNNILTNADFSTEEAEEVQTQDEPEPIEEPVVEEEPQETIEIAAEELAEEPAEKPEEEINVPKVEIIKSDNLSKPFDIFQEDEPTPLTDDKLSYLEDEEDKQAEEPAVTEEPSITEEEADDEAESTEPVEAVFSNWDTPAAEKTVVEEPEEVPTVEALTAAPVEEKQTAKAEDSSIPAGMKEEIKSVLSYMDQLLENLPEDKITEFAQSEQFETYKKLFAELGLS